MNKIKLNNCNHLSSYKSVRNVSCDFIFEFWVVQMFYYMFYMRFINWYYSKYVYTTEIIHIHGNEIILATSNNIKYDKIILSMIRLYYFVTQCALIIKNFLV